MLETGVTVQQGGTTDCGPAWTQIPGSIDTFHRFYIPVQGEAEVRLRDQWVVMKPGEVWFIPGGGVVDRRCRSHFRVHWIHFLANALDVDAALCELAHPHAWGSEAWAFWEPTYTRFADLNLHPPPSRLLGEAAGLICHWVAQLVGDVLDAQQHDPASWWKRRLAPAAAIIERRYCENPSLAELAKAVGLSPNYFHQRFCEAYHTTPLASIQRQRMLLAWTLLRQPGMTVSEVANEAGYPSVYYFSRAFRNYFHMSPTQARTRPSIAMP